MFKNFITKSQKNGFIALYLTILILTVVFVLAGSISLVAFNQQKISKNAVKSIQAFYAAESGIEDILQRLKINPALAGMNYNLSVGSGTTNVVLSSIIGGSRTVVSKGDFSSRTRKTSAVFHIESQKVSFCYGAQVGAGGMTMGNGSEIKGNVFSNGSVIGKGIIDDTIIVAGNGNKIEDLTVEKNASAHTCKDSTITGTLTYVSGGSTTGCSATGGIYSQSNQILSEDLPISADQINEWKSEAASGGIVTSNVSISGEVNFLGPVQIGTTGAPKNLTLNNNAKLSVKGTIYVTGDIVFNNGSETKLDDNSYGSLSGVILSDGKITASNGSEQKGSGETGSYIMLLSTNSSLDSGSPAIYVGNNAAGAIFYTTSGLIYLKNNMKAKEITGYKIQIENGAVVEYDSGLQNAQFTSGPGGSWQASDWKEIE